MRFPPDLPVGIYSDDSTHTAQGRWADCSNMRPRLGRMETIHGWESLIPDLLGGVCRSIFPWTDKASLLNIAFGTHATLEVYQGGELFDITPTSGMPAITLTDPFTVADASTTVTVSHPSHGMADGTSIVISGGAYVGRILPVGTYTITLVDADSYTITHGSAADLAVTLGSGPLTVTNGSITVTVADTANKIADGTVVTFSGATAVGGITPNGSFAIKRVDADHYTYDFTSAATAGATGGGSAVVATVPTTGGGAVTIAPQVTFAAGQIDGTGSAGFGTGGYGVGGYGEPSETDYFPRTWSLAAFGQNLLANPRRNAIFAWTNDTAQIAAPLLNAPRQVTYMLVAQQDQVFALGCNEEVSGKFNPLCIRHSSVRNNTEWATTNTSTAREYILPGGGEIVAGRVIGPYIAVWTTSSLFLGQYVGSLDQPWRFDRIGSQCGLIGPNAAVIVGQTAYWISPDRQFHTYTIGGAATNLACPIRTDFAEHLAASQGAKVHASSVAEYDEVWFYYPDDRDGLECSRYVALNVGSTDGGAWFRGQMERTASVDAGPTTNVCRTTADGHIYYHERGESADGGALSYFIESADLVTSEDSSMLINAMWPDFQDQQGAVNVWLKTRQRPAGDQTVVGPYSVSPGAEKVDMRAAGRYAAMRFEGNQGPAHVRLGLSVFELRRAGGR